MNNLEEKFINYEEALIDYIQRNVDMRLSDDDFGDYRERQHLKDTRVALIAELLAEDCREEE